jgi:hypothetical protein
VDGDPARRATLAGTAVLLPIALALAARSTTAHAGSGPVRAAGEETVVKLHDQELALERNTHYLQEQARLSRMLLQLRQQSPENRHQAARIEHSIRADERSLAHVEQNIALSRRHLEARLGPTVGRVYYLLNRMEGLAPGDPRVTAFVAFATLQQQTILDQLIKILNQEQASDVLPGSS